MSQRRHTSGGHRGFLPTVATGMCLGAGVAAIGAGLLGGPNGPPAPPESASLDQPASSAPPQETSPPPETTAPSPEPKKRAGAPVLDRSKPVGLSVAAVELETTRFVPLGIQPDGKIEVPERNDTVGWYQPGPAPGQFGAAVIAGHVDSETGPAIFYSLGELQPGDEISVRRADDKTTVFTVYAIEQYAKNAFPTQKVYTPTDNRPELRLITCGGAFDEKIQSYRSNIVVYAKLTTVR